MYFSWDDGDWTDDTDQMILIMEELINGGGVPEYTRYGLSIKTWSDNGFPELGDEAGCGLGAHTNKVLSHPEFYRDPFVASEDVWVASNKQSAANGIKKIRSFYLVDVLIKHLLDSRCCDENICYWCMEVLGKRHSGANDFKLREDDPLRYDLPY